MQRLLSLELLNTSILVNDEKNSALYEKYKELAEKEENVIFGGRLGMYQYFDMWKVIEEALKLVDEESI